MSTTSGIKNYWGYRSLTINGDAAHTLSVNTGNGNLVASVTDFVIPGRIPFVFMRTYNSSNSTVSGLLGKGWQLSIEERLFPSAYGANITYIDTTGAEWLWAWDGGAGRYTSPKGMFSSLEQDSSTGALVITMLNGFKRYFDPSSGRLQRYEDPNGNNLLFGWNNDLLTNVSVQHGASSVHVIINDIEYFNGRIVSLRYGVDESNRYLWLFSYDKATSTILERVTNPLQNFWKYEYTSGVLTKIYDPIASADTPPNYYTGVSYNGNGWVSALTDTDNSSIAFSYSFLASPITVETTITDRRLFETKHYHEYDFDFALKTITYQNNQTTYTTTYGWDQDLLRLNSFTDFNGHETSYTYFQVSGPPSRNTDCVLSITDACAKTTNFTYNQNCTLASSSTPAVGTPPVSYTTYYHYNDPNNPYNLTGISRPMDNPTIPSIIFTYNEYGDLTTSVDPCGQVKVFTYNNMHGSLVSQSRKVIISGSVRYLTVWYEYDADYLWVMKVTNECGIVSKLSRDKLGRITHSNVYNVSNPEDVLTVAYTYDKCGNLLTFNSPKYPNNFTTFTYTNQGWLDSAMYPMSAEVDKEYGYDESGNLTSDTSYLDDGLTRVAATTTFTYDQFNRLLTTTLPEVTNEPAAVFELQYDPVGNILKRIDACGKEVNYTYDALNRMITQTGPLPAQAFEYQYDEMSRLTDMIGQPHGPEEYIARRYKYSYDGNSRLIELKDPKDYIVKYEYYANDQLMKVLAPVDLQAQYPTRTYVYDSVGRVEQVTDAAGASSHYTYRDDDLLATSTTADSHTTIYTYDGFGRILRVDYPASSYLEYAYDTNSNVTAITGPDYFSTAYSYDARDRLTTVVRHDASRTPDPAYTTNYEYDSLNRLTSTTDPRDCQVQYVYNERSWLTSKILDADHGDIEDGFNYTFGYTYDPNGRLLTETTPEPSTISRTYNEAGQIVSMTVSAGTDEWVTEFTYDLWGMLTNKKNADGTEEYYTFDELGRLTQQRNFLNEVYSYEYDARGNNTSLVAPYGALTEFGYNLRDELTLTATGDANTDSSSVIENFSYTPTGKLDTYGGPNNEFWYMKYDDLGRWISATTSLGTSAERTYNPSNTLATSRDINGPWFSMEYNGLRQRTKTMLASTSATIAEYRWNWLDLEYALEEYGTQHNFTYDRLGRLTEYTETVGSTPQTTQYDYNWRGQVQTRSVDTPAVTESYTYDGRGLCTGIEYGSATDNVSFSYDAMGRPLVTSYGGQATRRYYYNLIGRMICDAIEDASGTVYATYYSYDGAGNRVSQVLDRKYTGPSTLPGIVPTDDHGNPVIVSGKIRDAQVLIEGGVRYTITSYPAKSTSYENLILQFQTRLDSPPPSERYLLQRIGVQGTNPTIPRGDWIEVMRDPITGETIFIIRHEEEEVAVPLAGEWSATPPTWNPLCNIAEDTRALDFLGRVVDEDVKSSTYTTAVPSVPFTDPDCPNLKVVGTNDTPVASSAAGRAGVKNSLTFDKNLLNTGIGAVNELSEPWASLLNPSGDAQQKLTIAKLKDYERDIIAGMGLSLHERYNERTGKLEKLTRFNGNTPTNIYEAEYDSFGRLKHSHYNLTPAYDRSYRRDWRTGDVTFEKDELGDGEFVHQHFVGHSHIMPAYPSETLPEWELRGPHGQVKWRLDDGGNVTDFYGYSSWGNRVSAQSAAGTGGTVNPTRYLDGDLQAAPAMAQFKADGGTAQDMTPQVGAQTGAAESGAAGAGGGGNPDCGLGGNASFLQDKGTWSIGDGGMWCGPARPGPAFTPEELGLRPISEAHLPGYGTSKAPQFAPPAAIDQAGIADQRLKGMWGAQRFHGPAPGKQTGSLGVDDYRNPRLPLPSRPGAGWSIGGGGMWCGPALVPRGIDPGLLGLPGGGGGAPLLGNSGILDQVKSAWNTVTSFVKNTITGGSSSDHESNGGSGGGGKGNTAVDSQQAKRDQIEENMSYWMFFLSPAIWGVGQALEDFDEHVTPYINQGIGWLQENHYSAGYWLQGAAEVFAENAISVQNDIDKAGNWLVGAKNWESFRNVFNYDNKYVVGAEFAATTAFTAWLGMPAAKPGVAGAIGVGMGTGAAVNEEVAIRGFLTEAGRPFPTVERLVSEYGGKASEVLKYQGKPDIRHNWSGLRSVEEMVLQSTPEPQPNGRTLYRAPGSITTAGKDKFGNTISQTSHGVFEIVIEDGKVIHRYFNED